MAARNYLAMIMTNIKAVGFDLSVLSRYAKTCPESSSILQYLKKKGIKTSLLTDAPFALIDLENNLGISPKEILYVGNKFQDIECANKAGLISVLVDPGEKNLDFGQQFSISSVDQLQDYL
jgi:ribonucleotide monophosphatase NagD (HAD superfamily)